MNRRFPVCCGHEMIVIMDIGKFFEIQCSTCKDVVYMKKSETSKPQLIDD
jgi:hypothetical protein